MTFLQPFILWGLPLILLPVLIHLFNRLRHRSMPWAAMMFLRSATRKSTRYARLKQFLILLFRVLAVLGLVMALSRPLAGGWMGWMLGGAPEVIMVLLDRSASMEAKSTSAAEATKRSEAVSLLSRSAEGFQQASRVVLIDSATRTPMEVPPGTFSALPSTRATDTAADLPAMMQQALDWFVEQRPGSGELWIASDLQSGNWQPGSERWAALSSGFEALPQSVRVRLLALNQEPADNFSIVVFSAEPRQQEGQWELDLVMDLTRQQGSTTEVPVTLVVNGVPSQLTLKLDGPSLRYRHRVPLGAELAAGWGYVSLPADGNQRDNTSYFVFGQTPALVTAVVAQDSWSRAVLSLAAAPDPSDTNQVSKSIDPAHTEGIAWADYAVVLWQGEIGAAAANLERYVRDGGLLVCFPPASQSSFLGLGWSEMQIAPTNDLYRVATWDRQQGPLADTEEGASLPVQSIEVRRRQPIIGEAAVLASFADGSPFLVRRSLGLGQVYFCSSGLDPQWSDLGEGTLLVPMMQRLLRDGARHLQRQQMRDCGTLENVAGWTPVDSEQQKDPRTDAGVYRSEGRLVALNRPASEDDPTLVEPDVAKALFGKLATRLFQDQGGSGRLQSELWRLFLLAMAAFLLAEAILILPERNAARREEEPLTPAGNRVREAEAVVMSSHDG
jgi:hypothetical protein